MKTVNLTLSFPDEVAADLHKRAEDAGLPLVNWLAEQIGYGIRYNTAPEARCESAADEAKAFA